MNLLLDVNIVIDLCAPRVDWHEQARLAIEHSKVQADSLWLYAGSVQTLVYNLHNEIRRVRPGITYKAAMRIALEGLRHFCKDKQWLAALAGEGDVFNSDDPEDEQLIRALKRFPEKEIKLLTRDTVLLTKFPDTTISPEQYCRQSIDKHNFNFIDLTTQQRTIRPQLEKNIHKVLHHGRYILGPEVQKFEQKLAQIVGVKHCIGVSSGTDALLISLMAQGVGRGDAVFTTPFTFIATAEVISLLGATPVFVDIDPHTFNIDPDQLKKAITALSAHDQSLYPLPANHHELTGKSIIPVDLFGLPADYDPIMALAKKLDLFVLEDAAQGLGGVYKGRQAGSLGQAAATSFFPAKPIGCYGDGGAVLTNDDAFAEQIRSIRVHGKGAHKYDNVRIGLNARLHTLQAAILLPKLDIFPQEIKQKKKVAQKYFDALSELNHLTVPSVPDGLQSVWAQYSLLSKDRQEIQSHLKGKGIPTAVYYGHPLHLQTAYKTLAYCQGDMPVAEQVSQQIFSLPMHPYLGDDDIASVVKALRRAMPATQLGTEI